MKNATQYSIEKVNKVICSVLSSPNKSVERASLWARLHRIRETIKNETPLSEASRQGCYPYRGSRQQIYTIIHPIAPPDTSERG